jgi:hypothetical protein
MAARRIPGVPETGKAYPSRAVFVAVPIALAANLCDVNANILAQQLRLGDATCDASALAVVP